jgi:hypothetical protein
MIGSHAFTTGYDPVIPNEQVFTLTDAEFAKLSPGMPVTVQFGLEPTSEYWDCGTLP